MTPEGKIENYLVKQAEKNHFVCLKFISPGTNGVPDRILIGNNKTIFIELKAPGKKPRALQLKIISKMEKAGAIVYVIDSKKGVDKIIEGMKK